MITSWQDILDKNTTSKPVVVGGLPRAGTTATYRELGYLMPDKLKTEEYLNPYYKYNYDQYKITMDIKTMAEIAQHKNVNDHAVNIEELREKIHQIEIRGGWANNFMKVLPLHLRNVGLVNRELAVEIAQAHFWILLIRRKWEECLLSNLYSNKFNKFHYYGDEQLIEEQFEGSIDKLNNFLRHFEVLPRQIHVGIRDYTFIYKEEVETLPSVYSTKTVSEQDLSSLKAPPPRNDKGKSDRIKQMMTNYDQIMDLANTWMETKLESTSNGMFYLDENKLLTVNEEYKK